ncbi:GGDEF domain-containing protein [Marinobacter sp. F3R08]|uniref:sensor domain-containing diguanylate cyclase n=1 Tax=Marinobacter sp. F3R08 TaxID=2841559 RepID=UPI001C0850F0|nr:GGDEF domain-containing protein [Marinobacter sp. F3R08]MBU2954931.1 GGDEF domain-containing protein [Marinobacter sp. F3R08]
MPLISLLRLLTVLFLALATPALAHGTSQPVTQGWEYRWGDSPFNAAGVPEWVLEEAPEKWRSIGFPSNPPGRDGRENIWFRVTLPVGDWQEPVLYIFSVDLIVQVWVDGENIYQYGAFDNQGRGKFEGWPWHSVVLPENYRGKPVYFRVFSNYTDIGLWGEISIMDHPDLVVYVLRNSLEALVIAGFATLIALLSVIFALLQTEKRTFASLSLFTIASALMLVSESQASLLIAYKPLMWDFLAAGSYYVLPVAMALLLEQWLASHRPWVINLIWKVHLVYLAGAMLGALTGVFDLSSTFPPFDALFLASLIIIFAVVLRSIRLMLLEQKILFLAFGFFCALLIADMAVAHGVIPWMRVPVSWGMLLFSLAVVIISLWHYARTQEALKRLNVSLEEQVAERTEKAEALARREQSRVRMLTFENEKNRILSDVITELQDCLGLTQAFTLLVRAFPHLCSPLEGAFYLRSPDDRYYRESIWGFDSPTSLPELLEVSAGLPTPSKLPELKPWQGTEGEAQDIDCGTLCFWLTVESASEGNVTEGILLLEGGDVFGKVASEYSAARLFSVLEQAVQRISITLSSIALREELHKFSYEDALTGLKNRRYFDQLFQHEGAVAQRNGLPLSLLIVDIDHFKRFNDTHGHEAGDHALKIVAGILQKAFRESDIVCRYGGEEFVAVMPGAASDAARDKANQLCAAVREVPIVYRGRDLGVLTVSVGVASWAGSDEEPIQILTLADKALYRAKEAGRNRVEPSD